MRGSVIQERNPKSLFILRSRSVRAPAFCKFAYLIVLYGIYKYTLLLHVESDSDYLSHIWIISLETHVFYILTNIKQSILFATLSDGIHHEHAIVFPLSFAKLLNQKL